MSLFSWLQNRFSRTAPRNQARSQPVRRFRPSLEMLENRTVPTGCKVTTPLDIVNPDDGVLSLREAVAATAPSGDKIEFDETLTGQTLTLAGEALVLERSLTIEGQGITINAGLSSCVFVVSAGANVTVNGLTLIGANSYYGSRAVGNLGNLTLNSCTLTGFTWTGIHNSGTLTINASTLADNIGGALRNVGTATVIGGAMTGNQSGDGGAIFNLGTLHLSGVQLHHNTAFESGGAIANFASLTLIGGSVTDNTAVRGGGIYNARNFSLPPATATISGGCILSGNIATGAYVGGIPWGGTYSYQWYCGGGGAIWNDGAMTITGCFLTGNSAGGPAIGGGAIYNSGNLTLSGTTVTGNTARYGAGIYNGGGTLTIKSSTISMNTDLTGAKSNITVDGGSLVQGKGKDKNTIG